MTLPPGVQVYTEPLRSVERVTEIMTDALGIVAALEIPTGLREECFRQACQLLGAQSTFNVTPQQVDLGAIDLAALRNGPEGA